MSGYFPYPQYSYEPWPEVRNYGTAEEGFVGAGYFPYPQYLHQPWPEVRNYGTADEGFVGRGGDSLVSSSTLMKVGLVAGGALAIYFIFRVSRAAEKLESVHEGVGRMAGKVARARYGGKTSALFGGKSSALLESGKPSSLLESGGDYKLLTA